jgi:hypothetical protein
LNAAVLAAGPDVIRELAPPCMTRKEHSDYHSSVVADFQWLVADFEDRRGRF